MFFSIRKAMRRREEKKETIRTSTSKTRLDYLELNHTSRPFQPSNHDGTPRSPSKRFAFSLELLQLSNLHPTNLLDTSHDLLMLSSREVAEETELHHHRIVRIRVVKDARESRRSDRCDRGRIRDSTLHRKSRQSTGETADLRRRWTSLERQVNGRTLANRSCKNRLVNVRLRTKSTYPRRELREVFPVISKTG